MPTWALLAGCEVDHVISRKHGGITDMANLAWSCARCNRAKGTDIASISETTRSLTRLFNPRIDDWAQHFAVDEGRLVGLTEVGKVTARLLRLNDEDRVQERRLLQQLGDFGNLGVQAQSGDRSSKMGDGAKTADSRSEMGDRGKEAQSSKVKAQKAGSGP